ncbi:signal transduction histidine kinase, nitrogen specific, NtrB [Pelosinus fermentans JBW45]|uniref:histidine kinase n=2 Tax=Pelosinus TaxID=365348 RepID=I8TYM9_9FIRM|nr:signal transduction histidine kinase, nitrogen specific, NtrB [Pelosinus fermentans JBW45]
MYENLDDQSNELTVMKKMHNISLCVMRQEEMKKIFGEIIETAIWIIQADRGTLQLLDESSGVIRIIAHRGLDHSFLSYFDNTHKSQTVCGLALKCCEHIIIEDITQNPFIDSQSLEVMLAAGIRSMQSIPIFSHTGQLLGILSTYHRTPHQPDAKSLQLLDLLAQQTLDIFKHTRAAVSYWWVHKKLENTIDELHTENLVRIEAQKKAASAYDQIHQMLERITDGFFALDNEWRYTYINSVAEKFWFCNSQDMLGKKIWDCFTSVQPYYDEYHKAKKENIAVHFEAKSNSTDAWLEVHAYPSPEGLSIYFRDITEHKAIEQKELEYRKLLEEQILLLNLDPDYTFIHDLNGKISFWGQGAARGYGWTQDEALSKISQTLLKTHFPIPIASINEEVLAKGKWVGELVHTTKDHKQVTVRSCWLLRRKTSGGSQEIIEIDKDITEEKKIREELGRLDTMKLVSQIAAGISHEIRNPMTTVRGYLQLLAQKKNYSEEKSKFELMIEELDRANQIITEFLSLAKNKTAPLVTHDLNEVIRTLTPLLEADAASQAKSLRTHLYPNMPTILLNTNEIRQLILNLVRNGFEATGINGKVSILTYLEDGQVVLAIEDNGCGIPADIVKDLGTPFLSTKASGTGLGIPTCYNIARRHNAAITVNTQEGGTTFYIQFPVAKI